VLLAVHRLAHTAHTRAMVLPLPVLLLCAWLPLLLHLLPTAARPLGSSSRRRSTPARIVLFGDSLSDNGNGSFALTRRAWPADAAYFDGRFSNGPTWIEYVAQAYFGAPLDRGLDDGAFGGATLDDARVQGYTGINSTSELPRSAAQ
jgi:hypothetical protein